MNEMYMKCNVYRMAVRKTCESVLRLLFLILSALLRFDISADVSVVLMLDMYFVVFSCNIGWSAVSVNTVVILGCLKERECVCGQEEGALFISKKLAFN